MFSRYQKQCTSLDCNQTGHPDFGFDWPSSPNNEQNAVVKPTTIPLCPTRVSCFPSLPFVTFLLLKSCPIQLFPAPIPYFYLFSASENTVFAIFGGLKVPISARSPLDPRFPGVPLRRLERAREGRSVTRGALGSAWVVAAVMLHAFEYILRLGSDWCCQWPFVTSTPVA